MRRAKWLSLFLALVMCMAVLTVSASASTSNDDEGIAPHYDLCPRCGGEVRLMSLVWDGVWLQNGEPYKCGHGYEYGSDYPMIQYGTYTWKCNKCGEGTTKRTSQEGTECHGFNAPKGVERAGEADCTHGYPYGTDLLLANGKKDCHGFAAK